MSIYKCSYFLESKETFLSIVNCTIAAHTLNCTTYCPLTLYWGYIILLFCPCSPVPTITWRKINGNIPKKARLRKSQAVLEIPNIQLEDSGTYECKAENPRGGTAFKGHLQVYSESEHVFTPVFFILYFKVYKKYKNMRWNVVFQDTISGR